MSRVTRDIDTSEERTRGELGNAILGSSDGSHSRKSPARQIIWLVVLGLLTRPTTAHASLFHGETLDAIANGIAWVVLIIAPIIGITAFWMVHILPEKIAEKKKHPQAKAIQVVCLLSLVFGGLLWPIAWLWAYTKPVLHKMAYGTDVDESHGHGHGGNPKPDKSDDETHRP